MQIFGLYKGVLPPLYGQVGINAVLFGIQGNMTRALGNNGLKEHFIAGSVAGAVQCLIASPMELVRIRLQMQGEGVSSKAEKISDRRFHYCSPSDCLKKIYLHEKGIRGLFRGMTLTLMREIPSFGTYFASYEYLCQQTNAMTEDGKVGSYAKLLFCGGSAGILCWIVTYPADVIKTRHQMDGMGVTKYNGVIDCAVKSIRHEGFGLLFRGMNPTLLRAFPTNAATLSTYTVVMTLLDRG